MVAAVLAAVVPDWLAVPEGALCLARKALARYNPVAMLLLPTRFDRTCLLYLVALL